MIPTIQPTDLSYHILYEDEVLLVVFKPQGMAVHPAPGSRTGTLVQQLREYYAQKGFPNRHIAAVSRLDKGTSGLILLATDQAAHPDLHHQVTHRQIRREYQCLVWGRPLFENTLVDVPLSRHWSNPRKMAAYDLPSREAAKWGARPALTHLQVVRRFAGAALLAATLETGRMHQIRVHCQFIRLPVIGDPLYGMPCEGNGMESADNFLSTQAQEIAAGLRWQCLHSGALQFRHPLTGERLEFHAPIPPPFSRLLEALEDDPERTR